MGGYLSLVIKAAGDKEPDKNLSSLPVSVTSSLNNVLSQNMAFANHVSQY